MATTEFPYMTEGARRLQRHVNHLVILTAILILVQYALFGIVFWQRGNLARRNHDAIVALRALDKRERSDQVLLKAITTRALCEAIVRAQTAQPVSRRAAAVAELRSEIHLLGGRCVRK